MSTPERIIFRQGKKVWLRPISTNDVSQLTIWINNQDITQYTDQIFPMNEADETEWIRSLSGNKHDIVLGIMVADNLIGAIGAHNINYIYRTCETGALIGEQEYRNKGFGKDAKMLQLDFLFNTLNLRKVYARVFANNERSLAYLKKSGYKIEGIRKKQVYKNGEYIDEIMVAIFKKDWLPLWNEYKKS